MSEGKTIKYGDLEFGLLYDSQHVQQTVEKVAAKINKYYQKLLKEEPDPSVTVICILKGAFMFFSDLVKHFDFRIQCEFMRLSSYHGGLESTNSVKFVTQIDFEIFRDKHLLIVEDIVDTGKTLEELEKKLSTVEPKSVNIATLVRRPDKKQAVEVKFVGLDCSDFIIGYGLDLEENFRCLPAIYQKI